MSSRTSIATAIAAGVTGMTLSYVAALLTLLGFLTGEQVCVKLFVKKRMEYMLYAVSLTTGHRDDFINPVSFWGQRQKDLEVFTAICSAVYRNYIHR
jgi:hypothetical protein